MGYIADMHQLCANWISDIRRWQTTEEIARGMIINEDQFLELFEEIVEFYSPSHPTDCLEAIRSLRRLSIDHLQFAQSVSSIEKKFFPHHRELGEGSSSDTPRKKVRRLNEEEDELVGEAAGALKRGRTADEEEGATKRARTFCEDEDQSNLETAENNVAQDDGVPHLGVQDIIESNSAVVEYICKALRDHHEYKGMLQMGQLCRASRNAVNAFRAEECKYGAPVGKLQIYSLSKFVQAYCLQEVDLNLSGYFNVKEIYELSKITSLPNVKHLLELRGSLAAQSSHLSLLAKSGCNVDLLKKVVRLQELFTLFRTDQCLASGLKSLEFDEKIPVKDCIEIARFSKKSELIFKCRIKVHEFKKIREELPNLEVLVFESRGDDKVDMVDCTEDMLNTLERAKRAQISFQAESSGSSHSALTDNQPVRLCTKELSVEEIQNLVEIPSGTTLLVLTAEARFMPQPIVFPETIRELRLIFTEGDDFEDDDEWENFLNGINNACQEHNNIKKIVIECDISLFHYSPAYYISFSELQSVEELAIYNTALESLPPNLKTLKLLDTEFPLKNLSDLTPFLRVLEVEDGEIDSIKRLPETLEVLNLVVPKLKKIVRLRESCPKLKALGIGATARQVRLHLLDSDSSSDQKMTDCEFGKKVLGHFPSLLQFNMYSYRDSTFTIINRKL